MQTITPIEIPFAADAAVVRALWDSTPVVLFPDETVEIRHRVADFFIAKGKAVVPISELERIENAAAEGRLVLERDQQCRAPLSRSEVRNRYFTSSPRVTIEALCIEDCTLQVSYNDPASGDASESYESRTIRRPHDPNAWAKAALYLNEGGYGVGGLGMFGASHPPPIMLGTPDSIGPWAKPITGALLEAVEPSLARCAHPDLDIGLTFEVRAAVAADGHVSRCTATSDHSMARSADADCLCQGIETLRYPKGRRGRRFRVQARDTGGHVPFSARFELLIPGTQPWVTRLDESSVLATCLSTHVPTSDLDATVVLSLATNGSIDEVQVLGEISSMPTIKFAACIAGELPTIPLPCRPPGIDQLQVRLKVDIPEAN